MTPTLRTAITCLGLSAFCSLAHAAKLEDVAPYPKAESGFVRQVIHLPAQGQEADFKVEILAGKTLDVDCNHQRLAGNLESYCQIWCMSRSGGIPI